MMGRTQLNLQKFDVTLRCVVRLFYCNGNNFDEIKLGLIGLSFSLSLSLSLSFVIISFTTFSNFNISLLMNIMLLSRFKLVLNLPH